MTATLTSPFIDGDFRSGGGGGHIDISNPATEENWHELDGAAASDADTAARGAQRAFDQTWRDMKPGRRAEIMFAIAKTIRAHAEELAQLDVKSIGKPIADARDEVSLGARIF